MITAFAGLILWAAPQGLEMKGAHERLKALLAKLEGEADPETTDLAADVAALAAEVARALGLAPAGELQDKVDEAVLNALSSGYVDFIEQLGKRAASGLAKAVRQEPDVLPGNHGRDPLFLLMEADPLAASRLVEELLALDGFFWKRRLIRAFMEAEPLARVECWTAGEPKRCLAEGLVHALEKYVADPEVGNEVLRFLDPFKLHGFTPALQAALVAALRSPEAARRKVAWEEVRAIPALKGTFEELLRDEDPDLRIRAAKKAYELVDAEVLYARADDPEPGVRSWVARRLGRSDPASWKAAEHAALQRLLADPDAEVQNGALDLLRNLPTIERGASFRPEDLSDDSAPRLSRLVQAEPLAEETYRSLAASGNAQMREVFARHVAVKLPAPLAFELLERLARDPARRVVEAADYVVEPLWWEDPPASLRVGQELLVNPARPRQAALVRRAGRQGRRVCRLQGDEHGFPTR